MKAVIVINYASEEDIGKETSIHLLNEENEWVEDVVIKPLPQERTKIVTENGKEPSLVTVAYLKGWNDCLKEITE